MTCSDYRIFGGMWNSGYLDHLEQRRPWTPQSTTEAAAAATAHRLADLAAALVDLHEPTLEIRFAAKELARQAAILERRHRTDQREMYPLFFAMLPAPRKGEDLELFPEGECYV